MSVTSRTFVTIFVLVAVLAAIWYLESLKSARTFVAPGSADITLTATSSASRIAEKEKQYPIAKELTKPSGFINTPSTSSGQATPFTIQSLIGKKVILVDFWTYSCINCIRTLPYVESWYEKYKDSGLVVIGVHTPEFDFEKVLANVAQAVKKFGITYPVVLDSDYGTWSAYGNEYWPHEYLIDIDGFIVHDQIGEGDYVQTETEIQKALAERNQVLGLSAPIPGGTVHPDAISVNENMPLSPETYFGSERSAGDFTLEGAWQTEPQYIQSGTSGAALSYDYQAQHVYFVAAGVSGVATLEVLIDGKPIPAAMRGNDVEASGLLHVSENRLYTIVNDSAWASHTVELVLTSGSLQAFTFTFG